MNDIDAERQEFLVRLRRMDAETEKFIAEQRKLIGETEKFAAEQRKLMAEADKFRRERVGVILSSGAAILAAGAAIGGLVVKFLAG
jgi:hypothetical protein